ncbi:MAG: hypothetical protein JWM10_1107 [Myxococcaceae bacterium]|nr:hypothetical protein [Myxococcaceae bacterium]
MRTAPRRALTALLLPLSIASPACLSTSYRVAPDELARLARTAPEQRWQAVRVTQRMLESDQAPASTTSLAVDPPVVILPPGLWFHGRAWGLPGGWRRNPGSTHIGGGSSHSGSGSSGSSGGGRGGSGPGAAAVAVAVVAAAGIVFVLAGTEGARYDGWVGVPPDELVYLQDADGSVSSLPLSALTPELAARSYGATIYEGRDDRYLRLGRAPLDRVGLTLQAGIASAMVPRAGGGSVFALGGRAFFGGFPLAQVGMGVSADVVAATDGALLAMVGGEAQVMPLLWGGVYLGAGWSSLTPGDAGQRVGGWYARGGVQLELPITTRLAASLRAGVGRMDLGHAIGALVMPELSLGLSVY